MFLKERSAYMAVANKQFIAFQRLQSYNRRLAIAIFQESLFHI
jgi:hypothetical protein